MGANLATGPTSPPQQCCHTLACAFADALSLQFGNRKNHLADEAACRSSRVEPQVERVNEALVVKRVEGFGTIHD